MNRYMKILIVFGLLSVLLCPGCSRRRAIVKDAFLLDAEGGSAWTLLYPKYKVVVPRPKRGTLPLAYALSGRDQRFVDFINQWIAIKQASGEFNRIYNHWILGIDAEPTYPRWSIIRDVLGWVE